MFHILRKTWAYFKRASVPALSALLLLPVVAHGLSDWIDEPQQAEVVALAGKYYGGDGLGYNLKIQLKANGTFHAEWHGCLGKYGEAQGHWRMVDWEVVFESTMEEGAMEGHLRQLHVFDADGEWILVAPERIADLKERGVDSWTAFRRVEVLERQRTVTPS